MINWKTVQGHLGVKADGVPGPRTYAALLAYAAGRTESLTTNAMGRTLAAYAVAYQMTTPERLCEFVAQICNETGGFRRFVENLNYSASSLMRTWSRRFPTAAVAQKFANQPEAIAERVYAGRGGNTQPGDGWKYRGRGALQLTFRANYAAFGRELELELEENPDLAAEPATSVLIALHFFRKGRVNDAVDKKDFAAARRITNGGVIGLGEVARIRERLLDLFE